MGGRGRWEGEGGDASGGEPHLRRGTSRRGAERQRAQREKLRRRWRTREPAIFQDVSCRHGPPALGARQLRHGESCRSTQSISALSASPRLCVSQKDDARDDRRGTDLTQRRGEAESAESGRLTRESRRHFKTYLVAMNLPLGLLVNLTPPSQPNQSLRSLPLRTSA